MNCNILIEWLRQKQYLTDLEKDILDTWNELQKNPLDYNSAKGQIAKNNVKYPEIFSAIRAIPTNIVRPFDQMSESDFRYSLENQLMALAINDGWQGSNQ